MAYKGTYKVKNPSKYNGDIHKPVIYRSLWERKVMIKLDNHPQIVLWASEPFPIWYISPVDGKKHRYYPDFYVKLKNKKNITVELIIEVKPYAQTLKPIVKKRQRKKTIITEAKRYAVNQAKWTAAQHYCDLRGWSFKLLTERELNIHDDKSSHGTSKKRI